AEGDDADLRVGELLVLDDLFPVVPRRPDLAGIVIAVDIVAAQLRQPRAAVHKAAGDRAELGVRLLEQRRQRRRGTGLPRRAERMIPFPHAPAVVASFGDQVDLLPQVLADIPAPEPPAAVPTELPSLPQAIGINLRPGTLARDERIVLGNRV